MLKNLLSYLIVLNSITAFTVRQGKNSNIDFNIRSAAQSPFFCFLASLTDKPYTFEKSAKIFSEAKVLLFKYDCSTINNNIMTRDS